MIADTFTWWMVIQAAGFVALPITYSLFRWLPGRGYAFCKPVGLLFTGYLFWLALSLHLLPNRPGSIVWASLPLLAASVFIVRSQAAEMRDYLSKNLAYIVAVELVFFAALFAVAHLKSFVPEIVGTEKPMDFMMLNAASRSRYFPPDDPWLSGYTVSYYYFGYVIQAMIAKLAAVPTSVAFNIALASTAALAMTAAFGAGYELVSLARRVTLRVALGAGLAAVLLLGVLGNLEGVLEFGAANGVSGQSLEDATAVNNLGEARSSDDCLLGVPGLCLKHPSEESSFWWWWRATRISPEGNSITEFPFFSFLLGDLHPHVLAIPFVLTGLALGLSFWASGLRLNGDFWLRQPFLLLV
jgi:YYY domain-containing protein